MEAWIMLGLLLTFAGVLYLWNRERRHGRRRRESRREARRAPRQRSAMR